MLRGRILGGSHTINFPLYSRGNRHDYDEWANYYGATGWTATEVLPFFLMSENNTDPEVVTASPGFHSTSGPVELVSCPRPDPIMLRWQDTLQGVGYPRADFSNLNEQYGTTILQTTQSRTNWTRQTTAAAFVEVNIARPNLHVLLNAHVTRILFQESSQIATGVEFIRDNKTYQVSATREVILSAGSINSPQILMLSGIGPNEHLSQLGIPILANLPVGNNLQDHMLTVFDYLVTNQSDVGWSSELIFSLNIENMYQFMKNSDGPLIQLPISGTYIGTDINGDRNWPDGMMYMMISQCKWSLLGEFLKYSVVTFN